MANCQDNQSSREFSNRVHCATALRQAARKDPLLQPLHLLPAVSMGMQPTASIAPNGLNSRHWTTKENSKNKMEFFFFFYFRSMDQPAWILGLVRLGVCPPAPAASGKLEMFHGKMFTANISRQNVHGKRSRHMLSAKCPRQMFHGHDSRQRFKVLKLS